jgi:hypothetical protein
MKVAFNVLDKILLVLVILSFSFLLIIQFINYNNKEISINTSWFGDDYTSFLSGEEKLDKGIIVLKNLDPAYDNVGILVNGEKIADFVGKNEVKIPVYHNDIVEIDGTKYNNKIRIQVVGISKNIERPSLDELVTTSQSIEILCKVQLK